MKKLITVVSLLLLLTSMSYASGGSEGGTLTIGVTLETFDDVFMQTVKDAIETQAKKDKVKVIVVDAKADPAEQIKQVDNFITNKVSAIVVHVINNDIAPTITKKAIDANIPLVYLNRKPNDDAIPAGEKVAAVASPEEEAGKGQAKFVVDMLAKKSVTSGNVVILLGGLGSAPQIGRTKGVKEYLAQNAPGLKVSREQTAAWKRPDAIAVLENWIASGDSFSAVFANNDEMALGASIALKEANMRDKVLVVGVDANADALSAIAKGDMDLSMFQNAAAQGTQSIETAVKMAMDESFNQNVVIPFEPVTKENVSQYQ